MDSRRNSFSRVYRPTCLLPALGLLLQVLAQEAGAGDWPRLGGPEGDRISKETGLLKQWPASGPKTLWRARLGEGFSGIAVANGRAFTMYAEGGDEVGICFSENGGQQIWKEKIGPLFRNNFGNGPRSTPVVDGNRVYMIAALGSLSCRDASSGRRLWGFNLLQRFGAKNLNFGMAISPLVVDDLLILNPGGAGGKSIVALDKNTGQTHWTSQDDRAGYSTPVLMTVNRVRQVLVFTGKALVSLNPKNGALYWRYPWQTQYDINAATPLVYKNFVFISSNYNKGCALLEVAAKGSRAQVRELYQSRDMMNHYSSSVLVGRHLYGFHNALLSCVDFTTGKSVWKQRGFGKGKVLFADGLLYVLGEKGNLALVKPSPAGYRELSQVKGVLGQKSWSPPSLANGKLFLRDIERIVCLDISGKGRAGAGGPVSRGTVPLAKGTTHTVAVPEAPLYVDRKPVLKLRKGHEVKVLEVRGSWVGVQLVAEGKSRKGWLKKSDLGK